MSVDLWKTTPLLDCLRPDTGWEVDRCVIGTYSADLVVLVATMLALAGLDDDRGSGSKVDFATAHERLLGRFRVVAQKGRIAVPSKAPAILAIMDNFVRDVDADESKLSWHPKVAVIKNRHTASKQEEWRLWLGSKNLTKDLSWDTGMLLSGTREGDGVRLPGMGRLGEVLARQAGLADLHPHVRRKELSAIRWVTPDGVVLQDVMLYGPDMEGEFPPKPDGSREVIVVSPFLDRKAVEHFGQWGKDGHRYLLSTLDQMAGVYASSKAALEAFGTNLISIGPPPLDLGSPTTADRNEAESSVQSDDEELDMRGLHAKIVAVRDGAGWLMWVGSLNATQRGWQKNFEVAARMRISDSIAAALKAFCEQATEVTEDMLGSGSLVAETDAEKALEKTRKSLASDWAIRQLRVKGGCVIKASTPPPLATKSMALKVALIGLPLQTWDAKHTEVSFLKVSAAQETELVHFQLTDGGYVSEWVQRVPLDPPPSEERDRRAIARHLDPRAFLAWIRSLMFVTDVGDGGGDWDEEKRSTSKNGRERGGSLASWMPTLEEILKAWAIDRAVVRDADQKVRRYFEYLRTAPDDERTKEETRVMEEFEGVWRFIRKELVQGDKA